ncbi:hypothetical protein ACFQV4_35875 [Streptomyces thermocarboxydus]
MGSSKYPTLGFDPAPGDLETVRLMVKAIGRVNRESGTAQTQLGRIGTSDGIWDGKAADTFVKSVDKIPPYLKRALDSSAPPTGRWPPGRPASTGSRRGPAPWRRRPSPRRRR